MFRFPEGVAFWVVYVWVFAREFALIRTARRAPAGAQDAGTLRLILIGQNVALIERGPYRWVRHPSYTAGMMVFLGVAIALDSWVSVAILLVVPALIYVRRARVEERAFLETIGEPYRTYMARTKRFIPFVV